MSETVLYKVPKNGPIEVYASFKNAFLGAFKIWSEMAEYYLKVRFLPFTDEAAMRRIWNLSDNKYVQLNDRIVMASTFDRVMVKREHLPYAIAAMVDYCSRHSAGSLLRQAASLHQLTGDETCFAVCWNQTSVNVDWWMVKENDDDIEPLWRMYDVSRDSDHWFLFDEIPLPVSEGES